MSNFRLWSSHNHNDNNGRGNTEFTPLSPSKSIALRRMRKPMPKLERAKTIASSLGANRANDDSNEIVTSSHSEEKVISDSSKRKFFRHSRQQSDEVDRLQHFCRGSIRRLKRAESKVHVAKKDMEQLLELAKSEGDLSIATTTSTSNPSTHPSSPLCKTPPPPSSVLSEAESRLAEDSRLAIEAQQEMCQIICQFADFLREEEERVASKADLLQRRSSQIHFEHISVKKKDDDDEDDDEDDDVVVVGGGGQVHDEEPNNDPN